MTSTAAMAQARAPALRSRRTCARAAPGALGAPARRGVGVPARSAAPAPPPAEPAVPRGARALVWYTLSDLRVDDHAGLHVAARRSEALACVALVQPSRLATVRECRVVRCALAALAEELHKLGGELHVRLAEGDGAAAEELAHFAELAQADALVFHACPSTAIEDAAVAEAVQEATRGRCVPCPWAAGLGEPEAKDSAALNNMMDYRDYVRAGGRLTGEGLEAVPLGPPRSLPPQPEALAATLTAPGDASDPRSRVPSVSELLSAAREMNGGAPLPDGYDLWGSADEGGPSRSLALLEEYVQLDAREFQQRWLPVEGDMESRVRDAPALEQTAMARVVAAEGGTAAAAGALNQGEAFSRTFSELLSLGTVSARRVRHMMTERIDAIAARSPLATRLPATLASLVDVETGAQAARSSRCAAAVAAIDAAEWHRRLAWTDLRDRAYAKAGGLPIEVRYWRWHGILLRYTVTAPSAGCDADKPPLVCVHGFGASADQWDDLMDDMAARGRRVFAVDLPGFGHAQKPPISYTQYLWEQSVVDFGRAVVKEPYVVAGNSIGGYTAASAAASAGRDEVLGLVLLNSAGRLLSPEDEAAERERRGGFTLRDSMAAKGADVLPPLKPPPSWLLELGGRMLFLYLQPNIGRICKQVYPNNPAAVDDALCAGILRDSNDPGAVNVLTSGAKLPMPISKNELLERYSGHVLVCQGLNDPLGGNQARPRFDLYARAYTGSLTRVGLEAGHCPHDEEPALVADAIDRFMVSVVGDCSSDSSVSSSVTEETTA